MFSTSSVLWNNYSTTINNDLAVEQNNSLETTAATTLLGMPNDNNEEISWQTVFRDSSRFWVHCVLVPMVVVVGALGNLITIYILTRKHMRSSTNVYLGALALSDLLFLIFTFTLSMEHFRDLTTNSWVYVTYKPFGLWLTDASSSTSVWLTVSFTIERYIAVCHPLRGKVLCTEERARRVAILVYLTCFLATSPTPFEWTIEAKCGPEDHIIYYLGYSELGSNDLYVFIYYWFSSTMFTLLPVIILAIFNSFLIYALRKSSRERKAMTNFSERHLQIVRQENRITLILIAVVIVFLLCQLPTAIFLIYSTFHQPIPGSNEDAVHRGLGGIFNLLMSVNAAVNFLLYTALSDKYRKYFCSFLFCKNCGESDQLVSTGRSMNDDGSQFEMSLRNTTSFSATRAASVRYTQPLKIQSSGLRRTQTAGGNRNPLTRPIQGNIKNLEVRKEPLLNSPTLGKQIAPEKSAT